MYWLKVGQDFYNLENITKIDYSFEEEKLVVNIYRCFHNKPLTLEDEKAAFFLETISCAEGCWAFSYPDEDREKIRAILTETEEDEEDTETSGSAEEEQTFTTQTVVQEDFSYKTEMKVSS